MITNKVETSYAYVTLSDDVKIVEMDNKAEERNENRLQQSEQLVKIAYEERQQMKMMSIPAGKAYKMAASVPVIRQIHRKLLCCSLCQQRYTSPKLLPCFHSFCQTCLLEYLPSNSISVACPICRHSSILPREGVGALQDNMFILGLMEAIDFDNICASCQRTRALAKCTDCDVFVCDGCIAAHILETSPSFTQANSSRHHIIKICSSTTGSVPERPGLISSISCVNHDHKAFEYFCINCETAICDTCRSLEHVEHPTQRLDEAMTLHKEDLKTLLRQAYLSIERMRLLRDQVTGASDDLLTNYHDTQSYVCGAFDALMKVLLEQKDCLLTKLKTAFDDKRKSLNERAETLDDKVIAAENFCRFTENALNHGDETELLMVRKEMTSRLSHLSVNDLDDSLGDSSFLSFSDRDFILAEKYLTSLDGIKSLASEMASLETSLEGGDVSRCRINQLNVFNLITLDSNKNRVKLAPSSFFAKLSSEHLTVKNQPVLSKDDQGEVELKCTVTEPGSYELDIRLFDIPIKGSPFIIKAVDDEIIAMEESIDDSRSSCENSSMSLTDRDRRSSQIISCYKTRPLANRQITTNTPNNPALSHKPSRVQMTDTSREASTTPSRIPTRTVIGRIRGVKRPPSSPPTARHVTPNKTNQNRRADRVRATVVKVGAEGREQGEFVNPQGVCYSGEKILVADSNNNCVQVFSASTGQFLRRLGKKGCLQGQLSRPMGVTVTPSGNYLVTDFETRYVSVYNPHGKYLRKFGGAAQMVGPKGMCVDYEGRVIVVDNKGCCVYIHQADGRLLHKFGSRGYEPGQFSGPQYCAVTADNDIIISDFHHNSIKVFSKDGSNMQFSFGSLGDQEGQFKGPTGVAVHSTGHIVVADWGNSRIQVFNADGTYHSLLDTSEDPLYGPQGLSITPTGQIIVADSGNHCFKIFRDTPFSKKL